MSEDFESLAQSSENQRVLYKPDDFSTAFFVYQDSKIEIDKLLHFEVRSCQPNKNVDNYVDQGKLELLFNPRIFNDLSQVNKLGELDFYLKFSSINACIHMCVNVHNVFAAFDAQNASNPVRIIVNFFFAQMDGKCYESLKSKSEE